MFKALVALMVSILAYGCASLSSLEQRDEKIFVLEEEVTHLKEQIQRDSITLDSIKSEYDYQMRACQRRYENASEGRDSWFFQYTACGRRIDTLYRQIDNLQTEIEKRRR